MAEHFTLLNEIIIRPTGIGSLAQWDTNNPANIDEFVAYLPGKFNLQPYSPFVSDNIYPDNHGDSTFFANNIICAPGNDVGQQLTQQSWTFTQPSFSGVSKQLKVYMLAGCHNNSNYSSGVQVGVKVNGVWASSVPLYMYKSATGYEDPYTGDSTYNHLQWTIALFNLESQQSHYTNFEVSVKALHDNGSFTTNPLEIEALYAAIVLESGRPPYVPLYIQNGYDPPSPPPNPSGLEYQDSTNVAIIRPTGIDFAYNEAFFGSSIGGDVNIIGRLDEHVFYPATTGNMNNTNIPIFPGDFGLTKTYSYEAATLVKSPKKINFYAFVRAIGVTGVSIYNAIYFQPKPTADITPVYTFNIGLYGTNAADWAYYSDYYNVDGGGTWIKYTWLPEDYLGNDYGISDFTNPAIFWYLTQGVGPTLPAIAASKAFEIKASYITIEQNNAFYLFMLGDPTGAINNSIPLYLDNRTAVSSNMPLYTQSANFSTDDATLYIKGAIGGVSSGIPIYMPSIDYPTRSITLFLQGQEQPYHSGFIPFYLKGSSVGNTYELTDSIPLFMQFPTNSGQPTNIGRTLYLLGDPIHQIGFGRTAVIEGGVTGATNAYIPLYLANSVSGVTNSIPLTLYCNPYGNDVENYPYNVYGYDAARTLYLHNNNVAGFIPVYMRGPAESGTHNVYMYMLGGGQSGSGIPLVMPVTVGNLNKNLTIYSHGW